MPTSKPMTIGARIAPLRRTPSVQPMPVERIAIGWNCPAYAQLTICVPIVDAPARPTSTNSSAAGVSLRTLNALCRRYHGATPMELLRNIRLDAARVQLLTDPVASITDTALTFGFGHLGRFSAYDFARFDELPRDPQKKRPPN